MDNFYPVFISLDGLTCLIVGMGNVGFRKLKRLLECNPARIIIVDKCPEENLAGDARNLLKDHRVFFCCRSFKEDDLNGVTLVFACTNDPEHNLLIAGLCKSKKILCNCITDPVHGNFIIPGIARSSQLTVCLSTNGGSPALTRLLMSELNDWLLKNDKFAVFLARSRPHIMGWDMNNAERVQLFNAIARSPLREWINDDRLDECREWLLKTLPEKQSHILAGMLDDLS